MHLLMMPILMRGNLAAILANNLWSIVKALLHSLYEGHKAMSGYLARVILARQSIGAVNEMEDEDIQNMAYRIAEVLNENGIDARRAEPILWMLLSNVYRLLKKKDGISTRDIASIIEDNKKVVLRESWFDADERLQGLL
jgi:hypothetical protein